MWKCTMQNFKQIFQGFNIYLTVKGKVSLFDSIFHLKFFTDNCTLSLWIVL